MKKQMKNIHSWPVLAFFVSACQLSSPYTTPQMDIPEQWHSKINDDGFDEVHSDPAHFVWWRSLQDPILDDLMQQALENNIDLSIAGIRVLEARQARLGRAGDNLPHIDGSVTAGHLYSSKSALVDGVLGTLFPHDHCHHVKRNINFFEIGFDADWEIDLFGVSKHAAKALDAKVEAAEETLCDIWVTLSAEIGRNYIELRSFQQQLRILKTNEQDQTETIYLLQQLEKMGDVSVLDILEAQQQLHTIRSQRPALNNQVTRAIYRLSILLGYSPEALFCQLSLVEKLPCLPNEKPIGLPSELLRRRPDIRRAERNLAAASETLSSSIAEMFPRLSLYGFIGSISTQLNTLPNGASGTWFGAPQLLLPIFNSRLLSQNVDYNKLEVRIACLDYQKIVLTALEEVENGIAAFGEEVKRNRELYESKKIREDYLALNKDLYDRGIKDYFEVLKSKHALLTAENAVVQGQAQLLIDYIALYKALGGGWCICM